MNTVAPLPQRWLDLDDLCHLVAVEPDWILQRLQAGLIEALSVAEAPPSANAWRFEPRVVGRLRSMRHVELCFGAEPELAALVADLEAEIARLRARLQASGG